MLLILPFTTHAQTIIAIGTVWRIAYALLTLKIIVEFNRQLTAQRSDAAEVSLGWLGWLIGVSAMVSALDLLRLNVQIELGARLNTIGYAISLFVFFIIFLLFILILNNRRAGLEVLAGSTITEVSVIKVDADVEIKMSEESAADYQSLFAFLDNEVRVKLWYCQPRLTLNQLSELSGMATRDISRCINLVAGMSFNDYINQHRIERIKQALQAESCSNLTNLAFAAGFSSKATFNQSFKKATGMTPSEFRNNQSVQNQDSRRLISWD